MDVLDEDNYPTEECLEAIRKWDPRDFRGLISLLHDIWAYAPSAIQERAGGDIVVLHTYGWSGNEEITAALMENSLWWGFHWHSSRRGGHHRFLANSCDYDKVKG